MSSLAQPLPPAPEWSGHSHDLLLTGIPRSGTSLLCNLLHRFRNCVMINEPEAISDAFDRHQPPGLAPELYRDLRAAVSAGRPLRNKLREGRVVEDTTLDYRIEEYLPAVESAGFILGTKDTLAYLTGLRFLRRLLPGTRFVACVRDPFETIASWKVSFPHLRDALVPRVLLEHGPALGLSLKDRGELEKICDSTYLPERRALWWNYLGKLILEQPAQNFFVVRYDLLISNPHGVLEAILSGWPKGGLRESLTLRPISRGPSPLDAADKEAIGDLCAETARALGLRSALAVVA